jgi:hypothetical protein
VDELTCPECGPFGVAGMVPVEQVEPYAHTAYRPCQTCNPVRYGVWHRYGPVGPSMASAKVPGPGGITHDTGGYPETWKGRRRTDAPIPHDRGNPRPVAQERLLGVPPPPHVQAAVVLSTEALSLPPGSQERHARVDEIEALVAEMERQQRGRARRDG